MTEIKVGDTVEVTLRELSMFGMTGEVTELESNNVWVRIQGRGGLSYRFKETSVSLESSAPEPPPSTDWQGYSNKETMDAALIMETDGRVEHYVVKLREKLVRWGRASFTYDYYNALDYILAQCGMGIVGVYRKEILISWQKDALLNKQSTQPKETKMDNDNSVSRVWRVNGVDFDTMSDDKVLALLTQVEQEIKTLKAISTPSKKVKRLIKGKQKYLSQVVDLFDRRK